MDPQRFDSLAKRLGARRTQRPLIGVGAAALGGRALSIPQGSLAQNAKTTAIDRYIAVRTYAYDSTWEKAEAELPDLVAHMEEQPGFVDISCVWGETEIYLVVTFLDEETSVPGMETIDWWIEGHIQSTLYGDYEQSGGKVFARSMLTAGCPCDLEDDDDPCGSKLLTCCPVSEEEGEPGVCLTTETTCPATGEDSETSDDDTTLSADDAPSNGGAAVPSNCTSAGCRCPSGTCDSGLMCCSSTGTCEWSCPCGAQGCACIASVNNTCDPGLTCCAPGEIGGAGTCQYACTCSSEGCSCTTGIDGACDAGLSCCGIFSSEPGSIGACLSSCSNGSNPCPGAEGCECIPNTAWVCNDGLICCGASDSSESGICQYTCWTSDTSNSSGPEGTPSP